MNPHSFTINTPAYVRNQLGAMARESGTTIADAAVHVLREALPKVQETWDQYTWPPKRVVGMVRQDGRASVMFKLPTDLFVAYRVVADRLITRALESGWFPKHDPLLGVPEVDLPTSWVLNTALQDHLASATPMPAREVIPPPPGVSDGPLVLVSLPASAVDWMLRGRYNRSAFIRSAIETQLPVLAGAQTIPPMSRLMPDAPAKNTPVRMSTSMHATLKATAKTKGVSMTHLMRAACLTHLAAKATKPAGQPA